MKNSILILSGSSNQIFFRVLCESIWIPLCTIPAASSTCATSLSSSTDPIPYQEQPRPANAIHQRPFILIRRLAKNFGVKGPRPPDIRDDKDKMIYKKLGRKPGRKHRRHFRAKLLQ